MFLVGSVVRLVVRVVFPPGGFSPPPGWRRRNLLKGGIFGGLNPNSKKDAL